MPEDLPGGEDWRAGGFGVYVHWPFCAAKCPYCDFNSYVRTSIDAGRWQRALVAEIATAASSLPGRVVESVFFGGGTPSLMPPETVAAVIEAIRAGWTLATDVEITLEAPPGDVRPDLSATARIVTDTRADALAIPIIALTVREHAEVSTETRPADTAAAADGDKKKETEGVFVVANGIATFRPVRVGIAGDEYFEVIDGVKAGETIVAGPYQSIRDLKDGAHVRQAKQAADSARATS